ncbi:Oidioi.mRNA.OKI2018_I69.chr2.g6430.t1.cds [Oikopleura dioica]|uniref:uridine/cytidine kinase n=1 Tax=Oikopleura dioica TaxID=34765 RepID=A0ABN7T9Z7_OIKDI|nr:Oidioi.mRNA.OKI2018_I69.chr2.g6430.t1.cds [Oikopleura dioica]
MSKPLQIGRRKSSVKEEHLESMANQSNSGSLNQAEMMMKTNIVRRKSLVQNSIPPIISSNSQRRELYTKGKPLCDCYVIGVAGGSASGKTSVSRQIIEGINIPYVVLLSMDNFFKGVVTEVDKAAAAIGDYNFDCPDAIDWDLFLETINRLKQGKATKVPHYSFIEHRRIESKTQTVYVFIINPSLSASVVLIDGIFTLHNSKVLELLDLKVFVNTDSDIRLARRLMRDLTERGRQLPDVLHQYDKFVKPGFDKYIGPTILNADVVIPRGRENKIAINLIIQHIKRQLEARHIKTSYDELVSMTSAHKPSNLYVLPVNNQIIAIQTLLRNEETTRDDFIFYAERLMRLTFEYALNFLPHREVEITLEPRDSTEKIPYQGKRFAERLRKLTKGLCGISILRAGETMEKALMKVTKDIRIGKILIQNDEFGSPCLHYCRVPQSSRKNFVILMDATISTGHAAMMAIRVLLDHDFQEENILLVSLLMANCGAQAISYAFPKVKIITATLDPEYDAESGRIIPGFGNFGDRYFGT